MPCFPSKASWHKVASVQVHVRPISSEGLNTEGLTPQGALTAFGKRHSKEFPLPAIVRADLRSLVDAAQPSARAKLLSPEGEEAFVLLNERLPAHEAICAIVYSVDALSYAKGYMALTDERLVFALKPQSDAAVQMIAIPLGDVTDFVFDSGMAHVTFGNGNRKIAVGMPQCGDYPHNTCERIRSAIDSRHPDPYQI
jgi:hypothetical protein